MSRYLVLPAFGAVTAEEAAALDSRLTPVGAERAGNADGSIPPWTGGYSEVPSNYVSGNPRIDPFSGEKPLFSISAANYRDYLDRLPEGQRALFEKFPDYRMDVYTSHRTAALPAEVYAQTRRNATRAHAAPEGISYGVEGAVGGVPFPIPKDGMEVVWNHLLAFWGVARADPVDTYLMDTSGELELTNRYDEVIDFPYYHPGATPGSYGKYYFKRREISISPPNIAGRAYVALQPNNIARDPIEVWQYLQGQRRVRQAPSMSYDRPNPDGGGIESMDDYYVFSGGPDRYAFRLLGKREMYVPYNNNRFHLTPAREVAKPGHANPDTLRYELHRVWVVDGMLASGQHHVVPHRQLYIDEDTWLAVYADAWDSSGKLWKFSHGTMYLVPDLPAVILGSEFIYDLQGGGYVLAFAFNDEPVQYRLTAPPDPASFSPQTLSVIGVR